MSARTILALVAAGSVLVIASKVYGKRKEYGVGRVTNPFSDTACSNLRSEAHAQKWVDTVGFRRYQEAYETDPVSADELSSTQRMKVASYVSWALAQLPIQCIPYDVVPARRKLYKLLWCAVVGDLVGRGRVATSIEDVTQFCLDPGVHPLDLDSTNNTP